MGRANKNIKMQLNSRIDELLRIGEKKIKDDKTNPNRAEGIHSIKTAETYRQTACLFGDYLKEQGVKRIDDINRDHVDGFLKRGEHSAFTCSRELSAINKMLDTRYTVRDFGLAERSYTRIQNNRGFSQCDTSNKGRNQQALDFVRACGMRRASISQVRPSDFVRNSEGQIIGVHLLEKGGRERYAVVIEQYRERVTEQVNHAEQANGDKPFLKAPDKNANPHWCRAEYAQQLYKDLLQAESEGRDYYDGMRGKFINQDIIERAQSRYKSETVRGYDRDTMAEVSQNLGHNRVDVVLYHYLMTK